MLLQALLGQTGELLSQPPVFLKSVPRTEATYNARWNHTHLLHSWQSPRGRQAVLHGTFKLTDHQWKWWQYKPDFTQPGQRLGSILANRPELMQCWWRNAAFAIKWQAAKNHNSAFCVLVLPMLADISGKIYLYSREKLGWLLGQTFAAFHSSFINTGRKSGSHQLEVPHVALSTCPALLQLNLCWQLPVAPELKNIMHNLSSIPTCISLPLVRNYPSLFHFHIKWRWLNSCW